MFATIWTHADLTLSKDHRVLAWLLGGPKLGKKNLAQSPFCKIYTMHGVDIG